MTGLTATEQIIFAGPFLEKWRKVSDDILEQRKKHIPLQYIVGYTEFMGLKFKVEPGVFIPRSDTECLVEAVVEIVKKEHISRPFLMDIGTGSGAIGVALAKRLEGARVLAVEIEETPFRIAKKNAELHKVSDRVNFVLGDWRENVPLDLDIIVSNPPYIPRSQEESLAPEVGKNEPHRALFGSDDDGLGYYRQLARSTRTAFNKLDGGWIACEFGDGQAVDCQAIFKNEGWHEISIKADLNGLPRVIQARATERFF